MGSTELTKMHGRVLLLSGDSNAWSRVNPVLMQGEVGIEFIDTDGHYNLKVGDGNTRFANLPTIFINQPIATNQDRGVVKIGEGINITADGTISVTDFLSKRGGNINGNLTVSGDIRGARVFNPVVNDYAEYFKKSPSCPAYVEAGEVVILDETYSDELYTVAPKTEGNYFSKYIVVGVVSDSYGHIVGGDGTEDDEDNYLPVALAGRVRVKVPENINIRRGDELMYSPRHGRVIVKDYFDKNINCTTLGIVVDTSERKDTGKVKILVK